MIKKCCRMEADNPRRSAQQGAALITSLLFLLVLSLLGLVSMQTSMLEERMAGNMSNRDQAFQAAEAALRDGEMYLENVTLPAFDGTNGLYQVVEAGGSPHWGIISWDSSDSRSISGDNTIAGVAAQPRYIIEELADVGATGPQSLKPTRRGQTSQSKAYRITARGVGGDGSAVVVLQTTFIK